MPCALDQLFKNVCSLGVQGAHPGEGAGRLPARPKRLGCPSSGYLSCVCRCRLCGRGLETWGQRLGLWPLVQMMSCSPSLTGEHACPTGALNPGACPGQRVSLGACGCLDASELVTGPTKF